MHECRYVLLLLDFIHTLAEHKAYLNASHPQDAGCLYLHCFPSKSCRFEPSRINTDVLQDEEEMVEHPELQMRLSVMAGLNAKLSEVTMGWQQMRSQWQDEDREEVARQLHTVTGQQFEPEEVDELVHNGGTEQIYRQAMGSVSGAKVSPSASILRQYKELLNQKVHLLSFASITS